MRRDMSRRRHLLIGATATLIADLAVGHSAPAPRPFESHDAVEMADFTEAAVFSPDARYFVTVTQPGLLPQGETEATLWLFDTAAVRRAVADASSIEPVPLARMRATINTGSGGLGLGKLLMRIEWEPDSAAVLFLGRDGHDNRRLFRVRLEDR